MSIICFQPAQSDAILPRHTEANGFMLRVNQSTTTQPGARTMIKIGFKNSFPPAYAGFVVQHHELNNHLCILGGLIDSDFRGELCVIGASDEELHFERGEEIAKMLLFEVALPVIVEAHPPIVKTI